MLGVKGTTNLANEIFLLLDLTRRSKVSKGVIIISCWCFKLILMQYEHSNELFRNMNLRQKKKNFLI